MSSSWILVSRETDLAAQQQSHPVTFPGISVQGGYGEKPLCLRDSLVCSVQTSCSLTVSFSCVLILDFFPLPTVSFLDYYVLLSGF